MGRLAQLTSHFRIVDIGLRHCSTSGAGNGIWTLRHMTVSYVPISNGFSTADAEMPSITYSLGKLAVHFVDWREHSVSLEFTNVNAFKWQDGTDSLVGVRDDTSYEVINSPWVAELAASNPEFANSRHFKLCFNTIGVLDVVSESIAIVA